MGKEIGTFNVEAGSICVSDPCYSRDITCGRYDLKAKNGLWLGVVTRRDEGIWGIRNLKLEAYAEGFEGYEGHDGYLQVIDLGVDSGQMGIFDAAKYPQGADGQGDFHDPDSFYGGVCKITLGEAAWGVYREGGIVTLSGYGDGRYPCVLYRNEVGEVVRVVVDFGDEGEDDEA